MDPEAGGDKAGFEKQNARQRIQERANILRKSIEKQLNFMGEHARVSGTKRLETPGSQKIFEEAFAAPPKINTAGWK